MYHYSAYQWLFFFYFYCFFGWCFESTYVSIVDKKLTNRGFMRGPFLPIYGCGAIMMLVVSMPFQDNLILTYLAGCVGATLLEYITGVLMEALFQVRYWDYSDKKFNFQGHICLSSTLAWGGLTILMTEVIHVPVERLVLSIPDQMLLILTLLLTAGIFADFALSFKAAIDLRELLFHMNQAKEEVSRIQKRLDVLIAVAGEEMENKKDAFTETVTDGMGDLKNNVEMKLAQLKTMVTSKSGEYVDNVKEELAELKAKYAVTVERHNYLSAVKDFIQRDMIRSNPGMTSGKYKDSLEEIKRKLSGKRNEE